MAASAREIVGGSALSIALRVAGLVLAYCAHILLSRLLGLAEYGRYAVALGWVLVLVLPAKLGFDYSALRFVTAYLDRGESSALRGFARVAIASVAAASVAVGLCLLVAGRALLPGAGGLMVLSAAGLILPLALLGMMSVMVRIARQLFASQFYDQILRPGALIVLLAACAWTQRPLASGSAMLLTAIAAYAALGGLSVHLYRSFREVWSADPRYHDARRWFGLSAPLLGIAIIQELLNQLEVIMLGSLAGPSEAGLFAAASRLASLMAFALAAFGIVSGPLIASAHHRHDLGELHRITKLTTRLAMLFAVAVAVALAAAGKLLLALFGSEFEAAYPALLILVAGGLVNAFTGIVVYLATLTGRERAALIIFGAALCVSFALNLVLIPRLGVVGAAIASSSGLAVWNLAMLAYVRRAIGIDASALGFRPAARP